MQEERLKEIREECVQRMDNLREILYLIDEVIEKLYK